MSALHDTLLVARREASERARSKAFLASTILTLLMLGFVIAIVVISGDDGPPRYSVGLVGESPISLRDTVDAAATSTGAFTDIIEFDDPGAVADALDSGAIDGAILDGTTVLLPSDASSQLEAILDIGTRQAAFLAALEATGLDSTAITELLGAGSDVSVVREDADDDGANEGVAFAAIILLFVVITTYGQWVLMGVLEEKSTRVVELVVASTSVRNLLAGKVLGIGVLGIGQLLLIVTLALVGGGLFDLFELPGGTASTIAWSLVWFVFGFAFYAVLYAAAGSLVSRTEDAQAAAMPIALVGVAGYLLTFAVVMPNPDSTASTILSMMPPIAPVAYPARIAYVGVPLWELLTAAAIMSLAVVGVVRLAARVYAGALLSAGARVKLREAWRTAGELVAGRD
jgi:ABC-2 type transport system permease protein